MADINRNASLGDIWGTAVRNPILNPAGYLIQKNIDKKKSDADYKIKAEKDAEEHEKRMKELSNKYKMSASPSNKDKTPYIIIGTSLSLVIIVTIVIFLKKK